MGSEKEAEIKLAEMEHRFEIRNKEAALKLKKPDASQERIAEKPGQAESPEENTDLGDDFSVEVSGWESEDS